MNPQEISELNRREKAYELATYFGSMLPYHAALTLSNEDIIFLYSKMEEKEIELQDVLHEILNGDTKRDK